MTERPADYASRKARYLAALDAGAGPVYAVLAPAKSGTTTVAAGLRRAGLDPVLHAHTLARGGLERVEVQFLQGVADPSPRHVWDGQWLDANRPRAGRPWVVASSVRDPIARLVSRFFQQADRFGSLQGPAAPEVLEALDKQTRREHRRLVNGLSGDWLEDELRPVLGRSIYDTPFDPAQGYIAVVSTNVRGVVLRVEGMTSAAPQALAWLLDDAAQPALPSENVGAAKCYSDLYSSVLHAFRPPVDFVARVYETRFARHFYSADELDGFRAHWTRPVGSEG